MKKTEFFKRTLALVLSLVLCLGLLPVLSLAAADTVNIADLTFGDITDGMTATAVNGLKISVIKNGGSNPPKLYDSGATLRCYAKNKLTITAPAGKTMTQIVFTSVGSYTHATLSASTGSMTSTTWTGTASEVEITLGTSGQFRFNSMAVTLSDGGTTNPGDETSAPTEATQPSTPTTPSTPSVEPDPNATTYTQVTDNTLTSGNYVMGVIINGELYALSSLSGSEIPAVKKIPITDGKITPTKDQKVLLTINVTDAAANKITIKDPDGGFIGYPGSGTGLNSSEYTWVYTWQEGTPYLRINGMNHTTRYLCYRETGVFKAYSYSNLSASGYHPDLALFKAEEAAAPKMVTSVGANVSDKVALDFYLNVTDYPELATAKITANIGDTRTVDATVTNNVATVLLYAKEMDAEITLSATIGGKEITYKYTFKQYEGSYLSGGGTENDKTDKMIKAVYAYGDQAAAYFAGGTGSEPDGWLEEYVGYANDAKTTTTVTALEYRGSSLILEDTIALRHYFYIKDDTLTVDDIRAKITGVEGIVVEDGGTGPNGRQVAIQINGITPGNIHTSYAVSYDGTEIITYSVANYCEKAINGNKDVANVAKALILLSLKAQGLI